MTQEPYLGVGCNSDVKTYSEMDDLFLPIGLKKRWYSWLWRSWERGPGAWNNGSGRNDGRSQGMIGRGRGDFGDRDQRLGQRRDALVHPEPTKEQVDNQLGTYTWKTKGCLFGCLQNTDKFQNQ